MSTLAMFGGTFDPFHLGHGVLAQSAYEQLGLDQLLVVPAGQMPHRDASLPAPVRLKLAQQALANDPRMEVVNFEIQRSPKTSYTVETLEWIRRKYQPETLFLVIGTDQFHQLRNWHQPERIVQLAQLAVAVRPGEALPSAEQARWPFQEISSPEIGISGTMIRKRLREGRPIRYLVPESIRSDIHRAWAQYG